MARKRRTGRQEAAHSTGYALSMLRAAVENARAAGDQVEEAIVSARLMGHSWHTIGQVLGVTGEAVRKVYAGKLDELRQLQQPELEEETP